MKIELKSTRYQFIPVYRFLAVWIQFRKDPAIVAECAIHLPYIVGTVAVEFIMVMVAAMVGAEFLICSPLYLFAAIQAFLFHQNKFNRLIDCKHGMYLGPLNAV